MAKTSKKAAKRPAKKRAKKKTAKKPKVDPEVKLREQLEAERLDLLIQLRAVPGEKLAPMAEHVRTLQLQHRSWVVEEVLQKLLGKFEEAHAAARQADNVSQCLTRVKKAELSDRLDALEDALDRQEAHAGELARLH